LSVRFHATVLGCGSSGGVPRIGNDWGACDPNQPRNRRTRASILVERFDRGERPTRVLVDTGPDVRAQLLAAEVDFIDAVIYTHAHADHVNGIDDLRAFWHRTERLVDVYADQATFTHLNHAFGYCFARPPGSLYAPILRHHPIAAGTPLTIRGAGGPMTLTPFRQIHGDTESLGLRVGGLAYSCDVSNLPRESIPRLSDLDVWIVDALRHRPHPSHLSVPEAIAWISRLGPRRAVLTHLHTDLDYATLTRDLPAPIEPAYDGMTIDFGP
jgi:phosphoribosyl 1,2-cyclic phosphate phosphodiesterase